MIAIHPIIDAALANASRRASAEDVAGAIVAGLRLIRSVVEEQAGYASAAALDAIVRSVLLVERLRRRVAGLPEAEPVPLPEPSGTRSRRIAAALVEDVVGLCIGLDVANAALQGTEAAFRRLLAHLVARLGGVPDTEALLAAIRHSSESEDTPPSRLGLDIVRIH